MDTKNIAEIIALLENSGLSVLELQQGDFRLRLEQPAYAALSRPSPASNPAAPLPPAAAPEVPAPAESGGAEAGVKEMRAPMVGVYHDAPSGNIKSGYAVKKGEVICVIEAMKLLNEIVMEEDGVIAWTALKDGDMVEYDQLLLTYN